MAIKTLYVGNLPYDTTEEELRQLFAEWGPVEMIRLISEKGFAFVDLPAEKVSDAMRGANGKDLRGRALRVDEARPRAPREPGSRSSGGGFRESGGGFRSSSGPREFGGGYRGGDGGGSREPGGAPPESGGRSRGGGRGGDRRDRGRDRRNRYEDRE